MLYYAVAILYEIYKAMYIMIDYFGDNEYLREWVYIGKGASNLFIFSWLLWVFRPRAEWPQFFTLEIGEIRPQGARGRRGAQKIGQMVDCHLTNDVVSASKDGFN